MTLIPVVVAAGLVLDDLLPTGSAGLLFLCVIMFIAATRGTGPALVATIPIILALDYFFLQPVHSFALQLKDMTFLALFAAAALFSVWLISAQGRSIIRLRRGPDQAEVAVPDLQEINEALRTENVERKRAEQTARLAEERLQAIIDTIPALVARRRADGVIDFVNLPWRTFAGLSQENPQGLEAEALHPEDRARIEQQWLSHVATGEAFDTEYRLRRADGEYRWLFVRRAPLRDDNGVVIAWYEVGYDIEDRKRAEIALQRSEAQLLEAHRELQLTINSIPVLVAVYEPDGTRSFVNQTWRDYTGLALKEGTGEAVNDTMIKPPETYYHYFHPDDVEPIENAWRSSLATGEPLQFEVRLLSANGEYRWHTTRRVPLRDERGHIIRWYSTGFDIEDQKRAEKALRQSEAQLAEAQRQLQHTIDTLPAMVSTYRPDGTRSFVNQTWLTYTGLTPEEAEAAGEQDPLFNPDDPERAAWRAALATGEPLFTEAPIRGADGQFRWHTIRRVPVRNAEGDIVKWHSVGFDIQEQKIAEEALRRSEAQLARAERELRLTLDTIPTLAWRARADGFAEYLNKRWLDYTGISLEQGLGWQWREAIHADDLPGVLHAWRKMLEFEKPQEVEARMRRFDGIYRWFLFRSEPLHDEAGGVAGWYGTNTDIEDRRQAESALHAAQAALAHASRVATVGQLSATIAHEVNQPLAAIVANGQACLRFLSRETPDLVDVRDAVEWMVKDGNRAGEVIKRIGRLLKKTQVEKAAVDINEVITEASALLHRELSSHNVSLQRDLAPFLPSAIGDRIQLQQVIINLVMNGSEAMQAVTGRPRELLIKSHLDEAHQLVVAVKDTGVGIPAEATDRVFEAFFTTKLNGLGMGLSICRSIIEAHGGRLWATCNRAEPGATFHFALPAPVNPVTTSPGESGSETGSEVAVQTFV
jgi:PAS domain S-box-containing protein